MAEQGLPTGFENSAATWQNMPMIAAMYTGQQNQLAKENQMALQEAFAKDQAQKALRNPLELDQLRSVTGLNNSQAGSADALARMHRGQADLADLTRTGEAGATNAKNDASVMQSGVTKGNAEAERYGQLSSALTDHPVISKLPPMVKAQWLMKEMGLQDGPNQEVSRGLEAKMDDLPGLLKQQADHVYQNSAAARAEVSKEAAAMSRTKETNKTLLQGKQMDIDAGRWTKLNRAGSLSFEQQFIKLNAVQQINALRQAAIQAKQEGNEGLAASYEARVQDPILIKSAEALASAGGAATIAQAPGQRPTLATKQSQVDLGTKSPSKADGKTFETRIKLD